MSPREGGGRHPPRTASPHRNCSKCGTPRRPLWQIAQDCERLAQESAGALTADPNALAWRRIGRLEQALLQVGRELLGCAGCGLVWPDVPPTPPGLPRVPWRLYQVVEVFIPGHGVTDGRIERISASGRIRVGSTWYNPAGRNWRGSVRPKPEAPAGAPPSAPAPAAPEEA